VLTKRVAFSSPTGDDSRPHLLENALSVSSTTRGTVRRPSSIGALKLAAESAPPTATTWTTHTPTPCSLKRLGTR
jgi:hypothetical protein